MGNAQPQPKQNSQAKFVLIRQNNGEVLVVEQSKVAELFNQSK